MSHLGGIFTPLSSCLRSAACLDSCLTSPSHCWTCRVWDTESADMRPAMDRDTWRDSNWIKNKLHTLYVHTWQTTTAVKIANAVALVFIFLYYWSNTPFSQSVIDLHRRVELRRKGPCAHYVGKILHTKCRFSNSLHRCNVVLALVLQKKNIEWGTFCSKQV